ncbi:Sin-like protein conserved region domain containing protein [Rhypophila sp. PSN 637]
MSNSPERMAVDTAEEDDDPIVATYSVFVKPPLPQNKKLVVFNYMNKTAPDPSQLEKPTILGLRVKPETGIYEVDIPIDTSVNYDKNKGIAYGAALAKSKEDKKDGSLGLAGGFGVGAPAAPRGGGRGGNNAADEAPLAWGEALRTGKALTTQTLSGGRKAGRENVRYMLGVVQGKNIHLTPASSVVALRPVAYHIDALTEQERSARQQPGGPGEGGPGGDKPGGRAIHMTLKAAMDGGGGVTAETIGDRLRAVQKEPWKSMDYYHDESVASWAAYKECLLLRSGQPAINPTDKGKGKEVATDDDKEADDDDSGSPELAERVSHLKTDWEEDDLLRAMAGIGKHDKKPGEEAVALSESQAKLAAKFAAASSKGKGKASAADPEPVATAEPPAPTSPARRRGRPARGGAAATTRGGRNAGGAAGSSARNAMQLD